MTTVSMGHQVCTLPCKQMYTEFFQQGGEHAVGRRVTAEGRGFTEGAEGLKKVEGQRKGREMREEEITNVGGGRKLRGAKGQ